MDMSDPSNSNDPNLPQGCLRCLIGSLVCRALTNVGTKQCNLMGTPIGNLRRMGLLYYLVGVVPSSRLVPWYRYIIGCIPAQSFLCTWPSGQFNIGMSPSHQPLGFAEPSPGLKSGPQKLPCRCLFRLPKKRSDCDCFFLLLGSTYTSPMLPVRPWNDNGLFIFFGHL